MQIIRSPLRVSLFGGGTDYPEFIEEFGKGLVVGGSINRYLYLIENRIYSGVHDFNVGVHYRNVEKVKLLSELKFKPIKLAIENGFLEEQKEYYLISDLPAMSGLGSSSALCVSIVALSGVNKKLNLSKNEIYSQATKFEQGILNEKVGFQDQFFSAHGGFGKVEWEKNSTPKYSRISEKSLLKLGKWLVLIPTKTSRVASEIAEVQINRITQNSKMLAEMMEIGEIGFDCIIREDFEELGKLINLTWNLKKQLASNISNLIVDQLINKAMDKGALGCKLLGAGSGGFILALVDPEEQDRFCNHFGKEGYVKNIGFDHDGVTLVGV
jgi:D-glycero-alpha-D-manno-heptose-7-phosphate kinase